jgi:hypothetical protein
MSFNTITVMTKKFHELQSQKKKTRIIEGALLLLLLRYEPYTAYCITRCYLLLIAVHR